MHGAHLHCIIVRVFTAEGEDLLADSTPSPRPQLLRAAIRKPDLHTPRWRHNIHKRLQSLCDRLLPLRSLLLIAVRFQANLVGNVGYNLAHVFARVLLEVGSHNVRLPWLRSMRIGVYGTVRGVIEKPDALCGGIDMRGQWVEGAKVGGEVFF